MLKASMDKICNILLSGKFLEGRPGDLIDEQTPNMGCALGACLIEVGYTYNRLPRTMSMFEIYMVFRQYYGGVSLNEMIQISDWFDSGKNFKEVAALIQEHMLEEEKEGNEMTPEAAAKIKAVIEKDIYPQGEYGNNMLYQDGYCFNGALMEDMGLPLKARSVGNDTGYISWAEQNLYYTYYGITQGEHNKLAQAYHAGNTFKDVVAYIEENLVEYPPQDPEEQEDTKPAEQKEEVAKELVAI